MNFRVLMVAGLLSAVAGASVAADTTDRLVVRYRDAGRVSALSAAGAQKERAVAGVTISGVVKTMSNGAAVYRLPEPVSMDKARALAARIAADPAVAYAAPDVWVRATALPNDAYANMQWPLQASSVYAGGSNFEAAWPLAGTAKVVVAVVDTGSVNHAEITANEIVGYDFISDSTTGGDADARDNNPTDEGDYCASPSRSSSWHGLKVAGLIAAISNNGVGVAGAAANNAQVLQVRALGRCGGYLSDVADAVAWSAGVAVTGVPANTRPAKVINLSLGAAAGTPCYAYMQDAVTAATARGSIVVAAAGNDGTNAVGAPANCTGAIAVGAHTASGDLADYSNYSADVALTAPGGGSCKLLSSCVTQPTITIGNSGTTTVGSNLDAVYFAGTSAATPHVSAAAALLMAANPMLTPAQVKSLLVRAARPHPAGTFCRATPTACGAGMLDVAAAMQLTTTPGLTISKPSTAVAGSSAVALTVAVDGPAGTYSYQWTQKSGPAVTLSGATTATARFTAPATKGADLVFTVQVTSDVAAPASQDVTVRVNNAPSFTLPATVQVTEGTAMSLPLAAVDADGDSVAFTVIGNSAVQVVNGALVWADPQRQDKTKAEETVSLTVAATDGAVDGSGDASKTVSVTVVKAADTGGGSGGSGGGATSGGSGGGGSLGWATLLGLAGFALARRRAP